MGIVGAPNWQSLGPLSFELRELYGGIFLTVQTDFEEFDSSPQCCSSRNSEDQMGASKGRDI